MKLLKRMPKTKPGYTITMHLSPDEYEVCKFPATKTKPEREKVCHKVLGYSIKKSGPYEGWKFKSEYQLITEIGKAIKNAKQK